MPYACTPASRNSPFGWVTKAFGETPCHIKCMIALFRPGCKKDEFRILKHPPARLRTFESIIFNPGKSMYLTIIVVYFVLVNLAAFLTMKVASKSSSEYLVAGRNMGVAACAMVVAAEWLGGLSTIGVSERAFTTGTLEPILYNLSTSIGMIIIGFTVARHYRREQVHTVGEMIEKIFGPRSRAVASLAFLIAYVILGFVQLQTCAGVVAPLFGISWTKAVLASALVITIYTYMGGMHAIALTGIVHMFARYAGVGIALIIGLTKTGGLGPLTEQLIATGSPTNLYNPFSNSLMAAMSLFLGGVLGGMAAQASIQPIFAAKDVRTARRAAILSAVLIAPFGILTAMLGLMARSGLFIDPAAVSEPKMALTVLLTSPEFIPPFWGGLALAGILAAILSTVGPVNFAIVTIATKDIYQRMYRHSASDAEILRTARRLVIGVNLLVVPLALGVHRGILEAAYASYAIRSVGALVILAGLYQRKWITETGVSWAFAAAVFGVAWVALAAALQLPVPDITFLSVGAGMAGIVAGNLYSRRYRKRTPG